MKKQEFMKEMSDFFDKQGDDDVNVNLIKGKRKAETNEPFVIFFYNKLADSMVDNKLTTTDLLVLFRVIHYVSWGNVINLTQETISDDLGVDKSNMSRSFKKLTESGIFIREKKSLFLNPNYLCMGDLFKSTETEAYKTVLNRTYKEIDEVLPANKRDELDKMAHESMSFMKK